MGLFLQGSAEIMASAAIAKRRKNLETLAENLDAAYIWSQVCENAREAAEIDLLALKVRGRLKAHYRADSVVFADEDGKLKEDSEYGPTSDYSVKTLVAALNEYRDGVSATVEWELVDEGDPAAFEQTRAELDEAESIIAIYTDERSARLAHDLLETREARVQLRSGDPDDVDNDPPTLYDRLKGGGPFSPVELSTDDEDKPYAEGGLHLKTAADLVKESDGEC